ncbi:MAG: hypothetical protein HGB31_06380 [Erysipelotrichaceae bacterium]|nr:hypothetical protein [Erysipelotrichaceae bacterium]
MIQETFSRLRNKKMILQTLVFGLVFIVIYGMIDQLNMPYADMIHEYGMLLVILNISLNVIMASGSAFMLSLSTIMAQLKGKESMGSNLSFISVLFGILTYGCTPCVIAFFASVGIAFSVIALPYAGLPYKFISLGLILIGILWTLWEIKNGKCKVKKS